MARMVHRRSGKDTMNLPRPAIIDIEVDHQETKINYETQVYPKLVQQKTRQKTRNEGQTKENKNGEADEEVDEEVNEAGCDPQTEPQNHEQYESDSESDESDESHESDEGHESNEENGGAASASVNKKPNKEEKKKSLPNFLKASSKYNFEKMTVVLCFWDDHFDWSLVHIGGCYDFTNARISEQSFEEITGADFVYNITPPEAKAKVFKVDISRIDRHILMNKFTVDLTYLFLDDPDMQLFSSKYSFEVPYFQQETRLQFKFLGHYHADKRITTLYNYKFKNHSQLSLNDIELLNEIDQYQRKNITERIAGNTTQMIKYALNIEDLASQDELKFCLENVTVVGLMNDYSFPAKRNKLPPNIDEMSLCLVPMEKYQPGLINFEDDCIYAQVDKIHNGRVCFEKKFPLVRGYQRMLNLETKYFVRFIPNRITYRACFQALEAIKQRSLTDFFDSFEHEPVNCSRDNGATFENFEWSNEQIGTNVEQMAAVKNIVNCAAYPFPYVVFGPPGTGKTSCIVECIVQILKLKPKSRIMVTAQSNSACDEVGVRLLKYVSPNKIFRFYSPSLLHPENGETSEALRKTSNLRGKRNQYPSKEEFSHFNVVIVTLMSCSRLVQFDGEEMNRNFDYIFVDECAAATEPEAFVPIVGLGTDFHEITTNIILLGDHKQLGPVISSDIAARLGLGVSLMERIMSKRRYRVNELGTYDNKYVTQLLDNFRSHPAILQFSNVLFYESRLRAKIQEPEKSFGTRWNYLNNKKFPVLFHCVKTASKIIRGGTSSYNEGEIKMVRFYVDLLLKVGVDGVKVLPQDIGIVSPYKAQLNMLRDDLRHEKDVEIGTAEYYQGREKKIIIISTVKSRDHVGFLKSEKRLNVCITRAKSLLILVGNADTLQQNSLWNSFMHFCKANDACCGETFSLNKLTEEEQQVLNQLNTVFSDLSVNAEAEVQPAIDRAEDLQAIYDRMQKVEQLMRRM